MTPLILIERLVVLARNDIFFNSKQTWVYPGLERWPLLPIVSRQSPFAELPSPIAGYLNELVGSSARLVDKN